MLQALVVDRRFAVFDLLLVVACGMAAVWKPALGFWCVAAALFPTLLRLLCGRLMVILAGYGILISGFLLTLIPAWYVAYDQPAAQEKLISILLAVLLFQSIVMQPYENLALVVALFTGFGLSVVTYFFLTHDFSVAAKNLPILNGIGRWLMNIRPVVVWAELPSGHVPGLIVLGVAGLAALWPNFRFWWQRVVAMAVLGISLVALLMTTSASVWIALTGALGALFLIWGVQHFLPKVYGWLPLLLILYVAMIATALYLEAPGASANPNAFGQNNRVEVFVRSLAFLQEYPFTGAGLSAFAGQYSRYILNIPYFYFSNSYNVFLDVAVEQGLFAGLMILFIYFAVLFRIVPLSNTNWPSSVAVFIVVFTMLHGLMQDYLYTGLGVLALFFPVGMALFMTNASVKTRYSPSRDIRVFFVLALAAMGFLVLRTNPASLWYSNLGAVQLARVELNGFPDAGWHGLEIVPKLSGAVGLFQRSLLLNPDNLTANYRLGLIDLLRHDFPAAEVSLSRAYMLSPRHRGVIKMYGYSLLWQGKLDDAYLLLGAFPEIPGELDAYYSWWQEQGRSDLADLAYAFRQRLDQTAWQP